MSENSVCPIWGTVASVGPPSIHNGKFVDSPRAGGKYFIFFAAQTELKNIEDELGQADSDEDGFRGRPRKVNYLKARLTSWLIDQRRLGVECPEIMPKTIEEMERRPHLPVHERADRLLQYIRQANSAIGEIVEFWMGEHNPKFDDLDDMSDGYLNHYRMMAWSECTKDNSFDEAKFLLDYLQRKDWIEYDSHNENCTLTIEGYARLAELEKVATDSSQAFVAMWFDDSMNNVYENGIETGIRDAGYEPLIIKQKHHIRKIDDEIIAEIRRSRFLVADFTHGDGGARGGVYYEAGFAHGLNIPVIFTCRQDILEKIHFDTRQYNHIPWEPEKLEEFSKALADRISAVIGDGPNKAQNAL